MLSSFLLLFASAGCASAAHWAVIVAGSNGYFNYRHQADACHAYQIMRRKGIPEANIIMMAYDDIAHSPENPFKGKLFNKPDPHGPGVDVYAGCKIDYRRKQVNPQTFLNILTGAGNGKVLKSTEKDHVFINFVDHGAPGLIAFPSSELHKTQLQNALQQMHSRRMFSRLVFYLESCESGSMFTGMKIPGVYAVSAANTKESSWGTYCPDLHKTPADMVNGKHLQTCLGDLFSVNWMEDTDSHDTTQETLAQQFASVKHKTNKSHVLPWGDRSFMNDTVSEYVGNQTDLVSSPWIDASVSAVSARNVDLHRLYIAYATAESSSERSSRAEALQALIREQEAVQHVYTRLVELVYPGDTEKQMQVQHADAPPDQPDCELATHAAIRVSCAEQFDANSGFALQFHQIVVNICADVAAHTPHVVEAARTACGTDTAVVV